MKSKLRFIVALLLAMPAVSFAWWHEDWSFRKQLTLDTTPAGANLSESLTQVPVLIRLHTGNFSYFLDMEQDGSDLRFVASDDVTPLKYHIESFDPINEMAMIWVQVPVLPGNANSESIWMYYGNPGAANGEDAGGTFDVNQTAVLHFDGQDSLQQDASAYANHPSLFTAQPFAGSLMHSGARFNGESAIQFSDVPTLQLLPDNGWTFSTWIRFESDQVDAVLLQRSGEKGQLTLAIDGRSAYARLQGIDGRSVETARNTLLTAGSWHHLALVATSSRISLYLDGIETAYLEAPVQELAGGVQVGMALAGGEGFIGELDEVSISNVARTEAWLQAMVRSQGPQSALIIYGEDGQQESAGGESYFGTILRNVTLDGWVVIVMLAVMSAISWVVMVAKGVVIKRIETDNGSFLNQFQRLGAGREDELDRAEGAEDDEARESPFLLALSGKHEHYQSSTLYRIYHSGVQEMHSREARSVGAAATYRLSPQAIDAIKATMDGTLVRENQKLNSQMVLLTIAISGGPFLGLLGTVVGVMITFAAIAASGDVNVNAIAPGIAAALVATVAGLAVAIPALFGYNWLGSKIKSISADMQVFVDEFITKVAEQYGR